MLATYFTSQSGSRDFYDDMCIYVPKSVVTPFADVHQVSFNG